MMKILKFLDWLGLRVLYVGLIAFTAISLIPWLCAAYLEEFKARVGW